MSNPTDNVRIFVFEFATITAELVAPNTWFATLYPKGERAPAMVDEVKCSRCDLYNIMRGMYIVWKAELY